jgi:cellulose synthase/poly-beta-1,6-N-acetylglucosamine synthase-like glycosyltransferase
MPVTASVVVTTFRRIDRLAACLEGLASQTRLPDEVVVVIHTIDSESAALVERLAGDWPAIRSVRLERHGLVAAYNQGLAASQGAIVAFVDDDAVPSKTWLEGILRTFGRDEEIVAVGGRDMVMVDGRGVEDGRPRILARLSGGHEVGRIRWFGRMIGNHHVGVGEARDVHVLKGVNMSFRRAAVVRHGFDERLRGRGVEVHSELSICLPLIRRGLRVVYDPGIVVWHYPAPRRYGIGRDELGGEAMFAAAHNEALAILDHFGPLQRLTFMTWGFVSGTTHSPGLAVLARDLMEERPAAWSRFTAAQRGRLAACRSRRAQRTTPVALRDLAAATTTTNVMGSGGRELPKPTVTVIVATYKRMDRLRECLAGLRAQTRPADEVIVVVHDSDEDTARLVEQAESQWRALRGVRVDRPGSVPAYNRGLGASRGAIVAFVDDDAVPSVNWLEGIVRTFGWDDRIAGVGGRDMVVAEGRVIESARPTLGRSADALEVGRIQWFGRMIANHHVGTGQARDVDVLKGVNMSFRRAAVATHGFDERLRGRGSQVHSELSICLPLRRQGLRLVYDPGIVVHHYPAPRPRGDRRDDLGGEAMFAAAHNEALAILEHFGPLRRLVFMAWGFAIGVTHSPGMAVLARDLVQRRPASWLRFRAAQRGRGAAWSTRRTARPVPVALSTGARNENEM